MNTDLVLAQQEGAVTRFLVESDIATKYAKLKPTSQRQRVSMTGKEANPFDGNDPDERELYLAWRKGWRSSEKPDSVILFEDYENVETEDAVEMGIKAFHNGMQKHHNPFSSAIKAQATAYYAWIAGYNDALYA